MTKRNKCWNCSESYCGLIAKEKGCSHSLPFLCPLCVFELWCSACVLNCSNGDCSTGVLAAQTGTRHWDDRTSKMHRDADGVEHCRPMASLQPCVKHLWDVTTYRHGHVVCATRVQYKAWQWHGGAWRVSSMLSTVKRLGSHFPASTPIKAAFDTIMGTSACCTTKLWHRIRAWVWTRSVATFVLIWSVFEWAVVMMLLICFSGAGTWWPIILLWDDLAFQGKPFGNVVFEFIDVHHTAVFSGQRQFTRTITEWWPIGKPVHSWHVWYVATANTVIHTVITVPNPNGNAWVTIHGRGRLWGVELCWSNRSQRWRTERSRFTRAAVYSFVRVLWCCWFSLCLKLLKSTWCKKSLQVFVWAGRKHHSISCGQERQNGVMALKSSTRRWAAEGCGRPCRLLSFQLHLDVMFVLSQCIWKNKNTYSVDSHSKWAADSPVTLQIG